MDRRRVVELVEKAEMLGVHGLLFQHVALCPTRVWLHHRRVVCSHLNRFMQRGIWWERISYPDMRDLACGLGVRPDQVDWKARTVSEVKSSKKPDQAARLQLLYYMAVLEAATGQTWTGLLRLPSSRRVVRVELDATGQEELRAALDQIETIIRLATAPRKERKPVCKGCAYRLLCWGESTEDEE